MRPYLRSCYKIDSRKYAEISAKNYSIVRQEKKGARQEGRSMIEEELGKLKEWSVDAPLGFVPADAYIYSDRDEEEFYFTMDDLQAAEEARSDTEDAAIDTEWDFCYYDDDPGIFMEDDRFF